MFERRSLRLPITLGVLMIVTLVVLTVGWVLLALYGIVAADHYAPVFWTVLSVGTVFLVFVLVGVIMYLTLSVKAINLNRRQANFVDSVTHELKSPIASLKLYLQTLNRRQVSDNEREDFYRFMLEDVERLDQLINHLLDAARMERATPLGSVRDVELGALLAECAESVCLRYRAPANCVTLDLQPCLVRASQVDLNLIFRNLIDNAVKYADGDPRVNIELRPLNNDRVLVRISDNGIGIPPKLRRKIFGRFVRLGLELERQKPGTGLGLYIVRTLVTRLKGSIRVRGNKSTAGTEFEVQLPGRAAPETPSSQPQPAKDSSVEVA
jgi:signal transduction histidine kinase